MLTAEDHGSLTATTGRAFGSWRALPDALHKCALA